jgi:hypothetical protein
MLGQYAGDELPPLLVSSGNEVYMEYETGNNNSSDGWQVEYLAYSGPLCSAQTQYNALSMNYFSDGSGPYNYTDLSDCGWLISPQSEAYDSISKISLNFHWLDLAEGDTLFVHDGSDATAPILGKYYGSANPGEIESGGNRFFLNFISDDQFTADGWAAGYTSSLPVYCSDTLKYTEKTGILEDGSGDKRYVPNSNCYWLVSTENTEVITFEFLEFDLEYGYDQLRFYDASVSPAALLATYFGHDLPDLLVVPSNKVMLWFFSDASEEHGGWKVKYTALAPGIGEADVQAAYRLSPNPARDRVYVQGFNPDHQPLEYRVYDAAMGLRLLGNLETNDNQYELDISALKAGMYFVLITDAEGRSVHKLIVR